LWNPPPVIDFLFLGVHKTCKPLLDQGASYHAPHGFGGEIGLQDQPLPADGEIADLRQIVGIETLRPRGFRFSLSPAQSIPNWFSLAIVPRLPTYYAGKVK
jgi:hypothetical protein